MQRFNEVLQDNKGKSRARSLFRIKSAIAAAMASSLLVVAGCGSAFGDPSAGKPDESGQAEASEAEDNSEDQEVTDEVKEAENADAAGDSAAEDASSADAERDGSEAATGSGEGSADAGDGTNASGDSAGGQDSTELYERFLRNEATVLVKDEDNYGEYWKPDNLKNMDVTLEGLTNGIIAYYTADNPNSKMHFEGIDYAYIDCGNDGNKELALRFNTPDSTEPWEEYIVIKAVDGVLETIYSNVSWSRSVLSIGEYGYIYGNGSGGAAYTIFDKSFIDADGKWYFIYEDTSTVGIAPDVPVYLNGSSYTIPSKAKLDGDYVFLQFDFNNTELDETDDVITYAKIVDEPEGDWESGYKGYFYSRIDDDSSIYEDSNPIKQFLDTENVKFYTIKEIDQMIADREASVGLTSEVKNGKEADWQPLDCTFNVEIPTFNADNILGKQEYFPLYFRISAKKGGDSYLTLNADGSMEGNYSDWNYNDADGSSVTNRNEFTGQIVVSEKRSDNIYDLQIVDYTLLNEVGTSEKNEYTKGSVSTINFVDVAGLDDGCSNFRLYCPGTKLADMDEKAVKGLPDYFSESNVQDDQLTAYVLYGLEGQNYIWTGVN